MNRCGTYAGYQVHQRAGETPCGPCVEAGRAYRRELGRRPEVMAQAARRTRVARRAARRLVAENYPRYLELVAEELAKEEP